MSEKSGKVEFHYGFYGGMRCKYECGFSHEELELHQEVELGDRPLRTDMALVVHTKGNLFPDVFGRRLMKHNIFEYKAPGDSLSIDDFCRVLGYAYAYKSGGKTVNAIPLEEVTVSIFCYMYPREAFARLKAIGAKVSEPHPGIYCVEGTLGLTVQALLIPQLPEGFEELKILAPGAKKEDVLKVLANASKHQDQGYLENIKAVLRVSMAANPKLYEEIREESIMVDMFEKIFSKELTAMEARGHAEGKREGRREGKREGKREGALNMLFSLVNDGLLSLDAASAKAGMTLDEFKARMKGWSKKALTNS